MQFLISEKFMLFTFFSLNLPPSSFDLYQQPKQLWMEIHMINFLIPAFAPPPPSPLCLWPLLILSNF